MQKVFGHTALMQRSTELSKINALIERDMLDEVKRLSNIGIWKLDLVNDVLEWSPEIYEMFELDPDRFGASYEAFVDAVHPDDRGRVSAAYLSSLETREAYSIEHRLQMTDGRVKHVLEACRTYYDENRKPLLSLGVVQDITERKNNERSLVESERKLSLLLKQTPSIIWTVNRSLQVTSLFDNLLKKFDFAENAQQLFLRDIFDKDTDEIITAHQTVLSGEPVTIDIECDNRFLHASLEPIRNKASSVRGCIGIAVDVTERKSREEANWRKANFDALTKLPNRSLLRDRLDQNIRQAERREERFALLFIDLDGFKGVNDSMGHDAGDEVLRQVAHRLRDHVRSSDTAARLAGDEFVIMTQSVQNGQQGNVLAEKLLGALAEPYDIEGKAYADISCSIGVAVFPDHAKERDKLLHCADLAMYRAKNQGKNQCVTYAQDRNAPGPAASRQAEDIRRALVRGEFELYLQPRYSPGDRSLYGAEALIRWQPPSGELLLPISFLGELEASGYMQEVDTWVLDEAFELLGEWQRLGRGDLCLAVNISRRQLADGELADSVLSGIASRDIAARNLMLELPEDVLNSRVDVDYESLRRLRARGVRIAINSRGSERITLSSLLKLSVDTLKIDRILVEHLDDGAMEAELAQAIAKLGNSMDFNVIAHGIESERELDAIRKLDCDALQGFLMGAPMSLDAFKGLLQR